MKMNKASILELVKAEKGSISKTKLINVLKKHELIDEVKNKLPISNDIHEQFYWWYFDLVTYPNQCEVCNANLTKFKNFSIGYSLYKTCSRKCAANHSDRINKIKQTNLENYGVTSPMHREEVKQKIKKTNLEKHGVSCILQLQTTKDKLKEKFGVSNISQSNYWKESVKKTWINKGGHVFTDGSKLNEAAKDTLKKELVIDGDFSYHQLAAWKRDGETFELHGRMNGFNVSFHDYVKDEVVMTHECGYEQINSIKDARLFRCLKCQPLKFSKFECEVFEFINSINVTVIRNDRRQIAPLELDLFLPEFNLAIECNGDYWHSFDRPETKEERNKHLVKLELCLNKNIDLIQITEYEWKNKRKYIESIILSRLGKTKRIYARHLECREIATTTAIEFFKENHIQGKATSKITFGLFENEVLVAAASIGKTRFSKSDNWELIRFATMLNYTVVGGFSKLVKRIKIELRKRNVATLESYLDRRLFNGHSLIRNGWDLKSTSSPGYCWLLGEHRLSRNKTQKHRLEKLLGRNFDANLSEAENMRNVGARRLWDCGQYKFAINTY